MITILVILAAIVFCLWFFQNQIVGHIGENYTANNIKFVSKGSRATAGKRSCHGKHPAQCWLLSAPPR